MTQPCIEKLSKRQVMKVFYVFNLWLPENGKFIQIALHLQELTLAFKDNINMGSFSEKETENK